MAQNDVDVSVCKSKRTNKHLIERKRRARINDCLAELKSLVLRSNVSEHPRNSKLEKADILEMTVDHIKNFQSSNPGENDSHAGRIPPKAKSMFYSAGYNQCILDVKKYFETKKHYTDVEQSLLHHLHKTKSGDSNPSIRYGHNLKCCGPQENVASGALREQVRGKDTTENRTGVQNDIKTNELNFKDCNTVYIIINSDTHASFKVNPNVYPDTTTSQQCFLCLDRVVRPQYPHQVNENEMRRGAEGSVNNPTDCFGEPPSAGNEHGAPWCWRPWYQNHS